MIKGRKSLAETHPEVAKQWHPIKNVDLTPSDVTPGSNKKVWWKCNKGYDHEWDAAIADRSKGKGCSVCSGHKVVLSNCLATVDPELAKEWHPTKNGKLTPSDVSNNSNKKVWWKCDKGNDHEWDAPIYSRSNGRGCSVCRGRKVVLSNCLATVDPELAKEWHPTKNGDLTPFNVSEYSNKKVWWKCDKADDHEWIAIISSRSNGRGCSVCCGKKIVHSNCFATVDPELAKEWHPTKNGKLTPSDVSNNSNKKVWWKCKIDENHIWRTSPSNRVGRKSKCPYCDLTPQSKQELTITFELKTLFNNIEPKGLKTRLNGRLRAIDIYLPKLNLCIEFDGSYWHKDKRDIDKIKSEMLLKEGFKLIRVREEPLKKIYDTDVVSNLPYNGKQITNDILSTIMELYTLNEKLVHKIKDYQAKEQLQNERGLDRYIDKILTEKAEKKSSK